MLRNISNVIKGHEKKESRTKYHQIVNYLPIQNQQKVTITERF